MTTLDNSSLPVAGRISADIKPTETEQETWYKTLGNQGSQREESTSKVKSIISGSPDEARRVFFKPPQSDPPLEMAVLQVIKSSKVKRSLIPDFSQKFRLSVLEKDLLQLSKFVSNYSALKKRYNELDVQIDELEDSATPLTEVEEEKQKELIEQRDQAEGAVERAEKARDKCIKMLVKKYSDLDLAEESFNSWRAIDRGGVLQERLQLGLSLCFLREQVINSCYNRKRFLDNLKSFIDENKTKIIRSFAQHTQNLDLRKVQFRLDPATAESHHRGKLPVKISFYIPGRPEVDLPTVFYKPRSARMDAAVIQLFSDLNALSNEDRSSELNLPTYQIINMRQGSAEVSIWEYIEGEELADAEGYYANQVIDHFAPDVQKPLLRNKLKRLEAVCKSAELSDLHSENLIYDLTSANPKIVPIDLESRQPGQATGLYQDPAGVDTVQFTQREQELIDQFKKRYDTLPFRLLPIPTSSFLSGLAKCESCTLLAEQMGENIKPLGYNLIIKKNELENLILNDFINGDVPYLTVYQSQLYYGLPNQGKIIGRRKHVHSR